MKLQVTTIERHPFAQEEPRLERIRLRPVDHNACGEVLIQAADSQECADLQPGSEAILLPMSNYKLLLSRIERNAADLNAGLAAEAELRSKLETSRAQLAAAQEQLEAKTISEMSLREELAAVKAQLAE